MGAEYGQGLRDISSQDRHSEFTPGRDLFREARPIPPSELAWVTLYLPYIECFSQEFHFAFFPSLALTVDRLERRIMHPEVGPLHGLFVLSWLSVVALNASHQYLVMAGVMSWYSLTRAL